MITPELLNYIQTQKAAGASEEQLRQALSVQGWPVEDINTALQPNAMAASAAAPVMSEPIGSVSPSAAIKTSGWSWGAFGFGWIWGIRFKVWLAFLTFVPGLSAIWIFVLGMKGREWAWKNLGTDNAEDLQVSLKNWDKWGLIWTIASLVITVAIYFLIFQSLLQNAKL